MPKLKPEVKAAWLEALRGGEYAQGTRRLAYYERNKFGEMEGRAKFCCLGVLCDKAAKAGVGRWRHVGAPEMPETLDFVDRNSNESVLPPESVREWAFEGFFVASPLWRIPAHIVHPFLTRIGWFGSERDERYRAAHDIGPDDLLRELAGDGVPLFRLNDEYALTFAEIADLIEETW